MKNWINVPYHSNQVYVIQENVIEEVVLNSLKGIKKVKLINNVDININNNHTDLCLKLNIKIKNSDKNVDVYNTIKTLTNTVEENIKQLIDKKPKNIQIIWQGFY
ncbi:MMB_0454 family protein [Mycoplasma leonicaptivi]|uniref:MMB_0454 family protein n=1 Tax=Mycoplasma leonicaptivi TaxID=36742 RepID=UPI000481B8F3|nr:hypothetical protein [Mycoplasma leonicaptivi]